MNDRKIYAGLVAVFIIAVLAVAFGTQHEWAYAFASSKKAERAASSSPVSSPDMANESLIWVTRKDGATSCGTLEPQTLEQGASELKRNGVKIYSSHKGNDGKMHAQACGMPTGSLNAYQISRDDLPKALTLGFEEEKQK